MRKFVSLVLVVALCGGCTAAQEARIGTDVLAAWRVVRAVCDHVPAAPPATGASGQ